MILNFLKLSHQFSEPTNEDELLSQTSTDFLDKSILNYTCLINESEQLAQVVINWPVVWCAKMWKNKKENYP